MAKLLLILLLPFIAGSMLISAGVGALTYVTMVEPSWLEARYQEVKINNLPAEFIGFRIVFFSDIHMDNAIAIERAKAAVLMSNNLQPDLVILGGDFFSRGTDLNEYRKEMINTLRPLKSPNGVLAVLGNHDHWTNASAVHDILEESGVQVLVNEIVTIRKNQDEIYFLGSEDGYYNYKKMDDILTGIPAGKKAILIVHEPDYAEKMQYFGRFDLQLSGHSHGGQVKIPVFGPLILPEYGEKYPDGLYQLKDMQLFTTRGVGLVAPKVRLFCRPEISLITLREK